MIQRPLEAGDNHPGFLDVPPSSAEKSLAKSYPVPQEEKLAEQVKRLEEIADFYTKRAPVVSPFLSKRFSGYASAIHYAITIIKAYHKLTKQLAEEDKQ